MNSRLLSLSQGCRSAFVVFLLMSIWPHGARGDRRPTREELAIEKAQQEALDAIDAERAQRKRERITLEEAEKMRFSPEEEAEAMKAIGKAYRDAIVLYQQRATAAAQNRFLDCFSLCQLSRPRFSDPTKLGAMEKGSLQHLEQLRRFDQLSAKLGGLQRKMADTMLPSFQVNDAELKSVLELLQKRTAGGGEEPLPNFTLVVSPEILERKITLDLKSVPLLTVLELVLKMAGAEAKFERHSVVITELSRVMPGDL